MLAVFGLLLIRNCGAIGLSIGPPRERSENCWRPWAHPTEASPWVWVERRAGTALGMPRSPAECSYCQLLWQKLCWACYLALSIIQLYKGKGGKMETDVENFYLLTSVGLCVSICTSSALRKLSRKVKCLLHPLLLSVSIPLWTFLSSLAAHLLVFLPQIVIEHLVCARHSDFCSVI